MLILQISQSISPFPYKNCSSSSFSVAAMMHTHYTRGDKTRCVRTSRAKRVAHVLFTLSREPELARQTSLVSGLLQ